MYLFFSIHYTVTKWFKKFHSGCKNLDDQVRSGKPKTAGSDAVLTDIKANPESSAWRVSGELGILLSSVVCNLHNLQNIAKLLTYPSIFQLEWGCPRDVMVKAMDCGNIVSKFVPQSRYYVHFRANTLGKGMNPLILPAMD